MNSDAIFFIFFPILYKIISSLHRQQRPHDAGLASIRSSGDRFRDLCMRGNGYVSAPQRRTFPAFANFYTIDSSIFFNFPYLFAETFIFWFFITWYAEKK